MITTLRVQNFKSLKNVEVHLEPFTVFVGPNGSGKTSILQAIDIINQAFHSPESLNPKDLRKSTTRDSHEPLSIACQCRDEAYRFQRANSETASPIQSANHSMAEWTGNGLAVADHLSSDDWRPWESDAQNHLRLPTALLLRLEPSLLVHSQNSGNGISIRPDGSGLHEATANLALNAPDAWQALQNELRKIIPTVRRLRHTPMTPKQSLSLLFDTTGADSLSAHEVSQGTLLVLGLLTALYATDRPRLVLMDDLDHGLHPAAQRELVSLLRRLMASDPELQIVATTHSPYLLDALEPAEVRMTLLDHQAHTVCKSIEEHPEFNRWKDEMLPGELWSMFGEKWLIGEGTSG